MTDTNYASHNGYTAEAYNCMTRPKRGRHSEDIPALIYLKLRGYKQDHELLTAVCYKLQKCKNNFVLPDRVVTPANVESMTKEVAIAKENGMDLNQWPFDHQTISFFNGITKTQQLMYIERGESGNMLVFGMVKPTREHYETFAAAYAQSNYQRDTLIWVPNTVCGTFSSPDIVELGPFSIDRFEAGDVEDFETGRDNFELMANVCQYFLAVLHRPDELVKVDYDINHKAPKLNHTKKRKGMIAELPAKKVRLYKPNRRLDYPLIGEPIETAVKMLQHRRRGHYRTLRNGRRVWVRDCIAGDPMLGSTIEQLRQTEVVN